MATKAPSPSFSDNEVKTLLKTMREGGVQEFSYQGLAVKFQPEFHEPGPSIPANYADELASDEKKDAVERSKRANDDYTQDLMWST